jgi:hypothetical protein
MRRGVADTTCALSVFARKTEEKSKRWVGCKGQGGDLHNHNNADYSHGLTKAEISS